MAASLNFILPELVLISFALVILMLGFVVKQKSILGTLAFLGVLLGVFYLPTSWMSGATPPFNMLLNDSLSAFFRVIFLAVAGISILISMGFKQLEDDDRGEYYFFLLILIASMMLAVSSSNLMMVYLAVEAVSIISYILVGFLKRDILSAEGGLKYFLFGTLSTGVMLYGITLVYGLLGTLDLHVIWANIAHGTVNHLGLGLALILILVGLGFKCAIAPFHMWVPDAYQGAPTPVTALLSVGPKAMGFALLMRIFFQSFSNVVPHWVGLVVVLSILSMTLGNVLAMAQSNIKRMLAFSSIAQAGYILSAFAVGAGLGTKAILFYIFIYVIMNLGAFAAVIVISNAINSDAIEDYAGLYKRAPLAAIVLTAALLSLTGIPPLAGFLGKFLILAALMEAKLVLLAVAVVVNGVIGLYYYVRVVKYMYLHEPKGNYVEHKSLALQLVLIFTLIGNVVIGIWPHPLFHWLGVLLN